MAIDAQGWIDFAERVPGHPAKTNGGTNPVKGIFLHSAEGYESYLRSNPPLTAAVGGAKSWHLTNLYDGRLLQHYPLTARCWHATAANNDYVGMEHEGKVPEDPSLTGPQIETAVRVIKEIAAWKGWTASRPRSTTDISHTLWEHREVTRLGGSATACPSGRIAWDEILRRLAVTPPPGEMEELMAAGIVWAYWDARPASTPFRSYTLHVTPLGMYKRYVRNLTEHQALEQSGVAGKEPRPLSLATLKAFAGGPEPDAP